MPTPTPVSPSVATAFGRASLEAAQILVDAHVCTRADLRRTAALSSQLIALRSDGILPPADSLALLTELLSSALSPAEGTPFYAQSPEMSSRFLALRGDLVKLGITSLPTTPPLEDFQTVEIPREALRVLRGLLIKAIFPPPQHAAAAQAWCALPLHTVDLASVAIPRLVFDFLVALITTYARRGAVDANSGSRQGIPGSEARGVVELLDSFHIPD